MFCLKFLLLYSLLHLATINFVIGQRFVDVFKDIKLKTEKFLSPPESIKSELYKVIDCNGYSVYSNNMTKVNFDKLNDRNISLLDGNFIDFRTFVQPEDYFLIHLGNIDKTWSVEEFSKFTTILDNAQRKANRMTALFGFTLGFSLNHTNESLPYLKASVRDLKQYMIFKNMNHVSIGLEVHENDKIILMDNLTEYFRCDNKYRPNFYFSNNKIIDFNYNNDTDFTLRNRSCASVTLKGINSNFIPYSPRASRCDCIMAMLRCVVDQSGDISFLNNETLLNEVCSTVYCGSIINEPEKGHYGVFASCSSIQKYSIAFNLYYSLHNHNHSFCNFNHKAKLLKKEGSVNDYMKLLDFDGKQCSEEILEDWNRYLLGISKKIGNTNEPSREKVYDYDIEFEHKEINNGGHSDFNNPSTKKNVLSSIILIWLLITTFML